MTIHARQFERQNLMQSIRLFNAAVTENRGLWLPNLLLELALAESITQPDSEALQIKTNPVEIKPPVVVQTAAPANHEKPAEEAASLPIEPPDAPAPQDNSAPLVAAGDDNASLDEIIKNWNQIRTLIKKQSPQTEALLNSCKPLSMKNGVLVLGFASDVVKSKMESNDNCQLTSRVISQIIKREIPVLCTVMGNKVNIDPSGLGIEGGGLVSTALNLGGKIVTKKKSSG